MDLRHVYGLVRTGDETRAVNDLEDAWSPSEGANLRNAYPGPLGINGRPSPRNLDLWSGLQTRLAEAYKDWFQYELDVVNQGQGCPAVVMAMRLLYESAFSQSGAVEADNIFAPKGVTSEDMAASLAALRVIQAALDELNRLAESALKLQREHLIAELSIFEGLARGAFR